MVRNALPARIHSAEGSGNLIIVIVKAHLRSGKIVVINEFIKHVHVNIGGLIGRVVEIEDSSTF
jgi:hypothetical protein